MSDQRAGDGVVAEWHAEQGWGVLSSPETPGGCWFNFGMLAASFGRADPQPGARHPFTFERVDQDGYAYRAVVVGTGGLRIVHGEPGRPTGAYRSELRLNFD